MLSDGDPVLGRLPEEEAVLGRRLELELGAVIPIVVVDEEGALATDVGGVAAIGVEVGDVEVGWLGTLVVAVAGA